MITLDLAYEARSGAVFPVIKESVTIREDPQGAVFMSRDNYEYFLASAFEAFILCLFDGTRTTTDLVAILATLKNSPGEDQVRADLHRFVRDRRAFVEVLSSPLRKSRVQVDPYTFLVKPNIYTRPSRPHGPLSVDLYVTGRCNLRCIYCFAAAGPKGRGMRLERGDEMDARTINCVVDQLAELKPRRVMLTGGEPTLRPELLKLIRRLRDYGIDVFLPTNGSLMNDTLAEELESTGLRGVQVKLDAAHSETQDALSGVIGSHARLIKGIRVLTKRSLHVSVVAVVTALNVEEIPDVIKMCADLGVDEVSPRIYTPGVWALHNRGGAHLNPSARSIEWLEKRILVLREHYKGSLNVSPLNCERLRKKPVGHVPTCPGLVSTCTILENGSVVPCDLLADFYDEFIMGNIKRESLISIWNSERAERWVHRTSFKRCEPCSSCYEFERCKGGCPWKSTVAYGQWVCDPHCIKAPDPSAIPFAEAHDWSIEHPAISEDIIHAHTS